MTAAKKISIGEMESYQAELRVFYGNVSEDVRENLVTLMTNLRYYPELVTLADMKAVQQVQQPSYSGEDEWLATHMDKAVW